MLSSFALIPYQAQIYPFITFYPPFTLSFLFYSYNDFCNTNLYNGSDDIELQSIRESKLFNGNPSDTFKDLGKQVFNYFTTPSFVTNIYETDELYYLEAELAGANKEDISIDFNNNVLTIQATRSAKYKSENSF